MSKHMTLFNNVIRNVEIIKLVTFVYFLSDFYKFNTLFLTNTFLISFYFRFNDVCQSEYWLCFKNNEIQSSVNIYVSKVIAIGIY